MSKIDPGWNFDNSYARLPDAFYTKMDMNAVEKPSAVILNHPLATMLGLQAELLESQEMVQVFAGNEIPEGGLPLAQAYVGHQFGHPNMLGDGRAMLLGEQITPSGERVDIQLKGSGRTPYSRGGDGRAALKPMLREYIISEAMYALGIPTTRSLAVVTTGETILREERLQGAILTRVASSHLRVGTFQYAAALESKEDLQALADYAINRHYPNIQTDENPYLSLLREVIKRQADLIAQWQLVGFIHGVMNTDNMTISGETIDYGPCAFMDTFHLETVFSSIDVNGRYAYGNQPKIGGWNLARFAESLIPLLHEDSNKAVEIAQKELYEYNKRYQQNWLTGMRAKLGLVKEEKSDEKLIEELLRIMQNSEADFTDTFRSLTIGTIHKSKLGTVEEYLEWESKWKARLAQEENESACFVRMRKHNPSIIPRNHLVEEALEAADQGDISVMKQLIDLLSNPYAYSEEQLVQCKPQESGEVPYQTYCGT
ncbi:protein adenylyltransferase SelO [Bacillus sp. B1-b2]|uniref:protein adenylyltransferase SelO n=1 Tax=Bacillus sp. B1-b2 TaxID=2653201 RepID=UPI001261AFBB|nr:YdiU family protein [Bacillus sp. B1-b2]KAB7672657.1 YdiU family protein [Bacillus sp. B1-b2]